MSENYSNDIVCVVNRLNAKILKKGLTENVAMFEFENLFPKTLFFRAVLFPSVSAFIRVQLHVAEEG
ncbi:hypothetical protein FXW07_03495 [Methanosarcina sp. DH1]|uniref:hypothetical protein n=1 Tax=Methanosarcina sp. DH1 TaxID=2605695 RepID=UPI001E3C2BF8|nr:hypothetical protein [Methanosarcina sp. DH1]MCC4765718.1 hypothetical protein [Methanosarcina sp. DH1]